MIGMTPAAPPPGRGLGLGFAVGVVSIREGVVLRCVEVVLIWVAVDLICLVDACSGVWLRIVETDSSFGAAVVIGVRDKDGGIDDFTIVAGAEAVWG